MKKIVVALMMSIVLLFTACSSERTPTQTYSLNQLVAVYLPNDYTMTNIAPGTINRDNVQVADFNFGDAESYETYLTLIKNNPNVEEVDLIEGSRDNIQYYSYHSLNELDQMTYVYVCLVSNSDVSLVFYGTDEAEINGIFNSIELEVEDYPEETTIETGD